MQNFIIKYNIYYFTTLLYQFCKGLKITEEISSHDFQELFFKSAKNLKKKNIQ